MPEIDRSRWAEEFKDQMRICKLKSKDLSDIGAETNYEQKINKFKNGAIPSLDCFLTLCRFFNLPPDSFLFAKPKWVECDIDIADTGVSSNRLLGVYKDVFYVIPDYKEKKSDRKHERGRIYELTFMEKEPNPSFFKDFHLYGTKYDLNERVEDGKIIYRFPYVNDEKTSEKIFSLLEKKKFSNKQIQNLLEITPQSLSNRKRKNQSQEWTIQDIYKLSWILNMPFESLIEIEYREETRESLFDPIVFIMHYQGEYEEDEEAQL